MEYEVQQQIGAKRHERSAERTAYRNGTRERDWHTRVGSLPLQIPKLRQGSYFPVSISRGWIAPTPWSV